MTIYVCQNETTRIEFQDEQAAIDYATANGFAAPTSEEKADPPADTHIPDVTPRQFRSALILSGISIESIEAALDTLPEPTRSLAKTEFEYSIAFQRQRPLVASVGAMLGYSSQQLDDLWLLAATL